MSIQKAHAWEVNLPKGRKALSYSGTPSNGDRPLYVEPPLQGASELVGKTVWPCEIHQFAATLPQFEKLRPEQQNIVRNALLLVLIGGIPLTVFSSMTTTEKESW
ncbi:TPA: hypothetical protein MO340_004264 [Salmonella enterica subsp. salamae serovar 35:g,m,s,t:-]|nr:hypothetical protein [Salmonella enterica subsp. salamae serovar 35:g,m,s,t:-]HCA3549734.1 hypothetical protein [Salmonella enterica subsp. salamae serovar 35:g,m,s,t:-]